MTISCKNHGVTLQKKSNSLYIILFNWDCYIRMSCTFTSIRTNAVQCLIQCLTQNGSSLNGHYYGRGLRAGLPVFSSAPSPAQGWTLQSGKGEPQPLWLSDTSLHSVSQADCIGQRCKGGRKGKLLHWKRYQVTSDDYGMWAAYLDSFFVCMRFPFKLGLLLQLPPLCLLQPQVI